MMDYRLKEDIYCKARELGAELIGTCSVSMWEVEPIQSPEFWPVNIWPWVKNVIVLAIPLLYPMASTAPSMLYQEQYNTSNRIMDNMSYFLAKYIMMEKGYNAIFFPRDCYDNVTVLLGKEAVAFSHVIAGYYAGLGTVGDSHNLITKEFGPRIRLVSVLTDAPIEPDKKCEKDLCIHCEKCMKKCPAGCFSNKEKSPYDMDKDKCTLYHMDLAKQHHWPCGYCATFCPIGEDLKRYRGIQVVTADGIKHCQYYGS